LKEYATAQLRNVALAGHTSAGKTTLAEAILYALKFTDRLGRVEEGNTVSDYDPEEVKRQLSITASVLPVEYKDHKINVLDLPGYRDFIGEIKSCMRVADGALLVLDATGGVEVGTEFAWEYAEEYGLPRAFFVNKLDKERADFAGAVQNIRNVFGVRAVPVVLPVGKEAQLEGLIDLLQMKMVTEEPGGKGTSTPIPDTLKEEAEAARAELVEAAAEGDDELTMKYLDDQPLSEDEIWRGIKEGMMAGKLFPVLCGAATRSLGVGSLLNFIVSCFPSPLERPGMVGKVSGGDKEKEQRCDATQPFSAFVFKTVSDPYAGRLNFFKIVSGSVSSDSVVYNVTKRTEEKISHLLCVRGKKQENVHQLAAGDIGSVAKLSATATNDTLCDASHQIEYPPTALPPLTYAMAIVAKSKTDEEKVGLAMHRLIEQDPTLSLRRDQEVRQTILSGMGDMHLDVAVSRLRDQSNVTVDLGEPRVPYRETITRKAEGQGKYKKQSGGRGQYGDVWLRLEPVSRGAGFEFSWEIVGGVIPSKYEPSVQKGIIEAMEKGVVAGYRVVDVKATCYDGTYHSVDSSDIAFKIAASMAFRKVALEANPILLEPIMNLKVTVPESFMGDVMGDLSAKRGRIMGNLPHGRKIVIEGQVPLAEMFAYSKELRSMTQGRGVYEMTFSHYEQVPSNLQEKIIAEAAARKKEEEA
jgi:elongation factor G